MGTTVESKSLGMMVEIPLVLYLESEMKRLYYRFGVGPSITRFNYSDKSLPEFEVTSLFTYYFATGYRHPIGKRFELLANIEVLVNSPIKLWEYLPETLQSDIDDAVHQEYNSFDYVSLIGNGKISLGVRYYFKTKASLASEPWQHFGTLAPTVVANVA